MQTYSHFLLTAALHQPLMRHKSKRLPPLRARALMLGSIMPDIPLTLMAIGCGIYDLLLGVDYTAGEVIFIQGTLNKLFGDWFFTNPLVIVPHNLFQSPILITAYILLGYWLWKRKQAFGSWLFWFAGACMLHALTDIPLHNDDGPLLLFPFNWSARFISPISYWDDEHYGHEFFIFEHSLDIVLIVLLLAVYTPKIWRRLQR